MQLKTVECSKCGAPLKLEQQQQSVTCEFCGTEHLNTDFSEPVIEVPEPEPAPPPPLIPRPKMSGCLIAFLAVCCFPGMLAYVIVKAVQQRDWDNKYIK